MSGSIPEFPCWDCGINTCPLEGDREYYEVEDIVWHRAHGIGYGQTDNGTEGYFLCIGCLEGRLGRKLKPLDFKDLPANRPSPWLSDRLNDRLGGKIAEPDRANATQYYPNALHGAILDRFQPRRVGFTPAGAACIGITTE